MNSFDPFDIWATDRIGELKSSWYAGKKMVLPLIACVYFLDLIAPRLLRRTLGVSKSNFAHVLAFLHSTKYALSDSEFVERVSKMRAGFGWGLGFKWYSANGVYAASVPFITSTPYVMNTLLDIDCSCPAKSYARKLFDETWLFLNSLKVMHEDDKTLALSYSPKHEPYIVVNANSYAAWAYAMHARNGAPKLRKEAKAKALKIVRWIIAQQYDDGRWYYLADRGPHDMIDGFHSCFVVRNLLHVQKLIPSASPLIQDAVERGWSYIKRDLFDRSVGLLRRYSVISRLDPFRYDLYDQAEYLGLLIDFGELEEACDLQKRVHKRFVKNGTWYCRIDRLGRCWGPDFLRWGIAQFWANEARLEDHIGDLK